MKIKAEIREDGIYAFNAAGGEGCKLEAHELITFFGVGAVVTIKKVKRGRKR